MPLSLYFCSAVVRPVIEDAHRSLSFLIASRDRIPTSSRRVVASVPVIVSVTLYSVVFCCGFCSFHVDDSTLSSEACQVLARKFFRVEFNETVPLDWLRDWGVVRIDGNHRPVVKVFPCPPPVPFNIYSYGVREFVCHLTILHPSPRIVQP